MRKVLFLDIDGVLNPKWWNGKKPSDRYGVLFETNAVANLEKIIAETGANIVISSSWKEMGLTTMQSMWKDRKLPGKVIDVTPNYMSDEILLNADLDDTSLDHLYIRGYEIKGWLSIHGEEVCNYIIIDDMDDILPEQQNHFVYIDPEKGITDFDAKKAIMLLKQ